MVFMRERLIQRGGRGKNNVYVIWIYLSIHLCVYLIYQQYQCVCIIMNQMSWLPARSVLSVFPAPSAPFHLYRFRLDVSYSSPDSDDAPRCPSLSFCFSKLN